MSKKHKDNTYEQYDEYGVYTGTPFNYTAAIIAILGLIVIYFMVG